MYEIRRSEGRQKPLEMHIDYVPPEFAVSVLRWFRKNHPDDMFLMYRMAS